MSEVYGDLIMMSGDFCTLTVLPEKKKIRVKSGTNLLSALISAGADIESVCGGKGDCGKCRVVIRGWKGSKTGNAQERMFFTPGELRQGCRLACANAVKEDISVLIPEESRTAKHQVLSSSHEAPLEKIDPLCRKITVELAKPSLNDNQSDFSRLRSALDLKYGMKNAAISHSALKSLASVLRKNKWKISVTAADTGGGAEIISVGSAGGRGKCLGIAVDIGTTTVVASLVDLMTGKTVGTASDYNRQIKRGEDVLSRIAYAEDENGITELNGLVTGTVNSLIEELLRKTNSGADEIASGVVAGNTTMTHLFYSLDPGHIRLEPYIPTATHMPVLSAKELGIKINPDARVHCVPGRSSYVGGDITADILTAGMHKEKGLSLLIDVGTNGEVVLGNDEWLVGCSCSAGPAFEGGEVKCGLRAMTGAIEKIAIEDSHANGFDVKYSTIGGAQPRGICGSGLIDLLAGMFQSGAIDRAGKIQELASKRIREDGGGRRFIVAFAKESATGRDLSIGDVDIKNIMRTKAAVYAACSVLVKKMGFSFSDIERIYIAGGFGNYIDLENAVLLGLLPDVARDKFRFIGNGSLGGARLALLSREKMKEADEVVRKMTYIELSTDSMFFDEYSSALFLPHTDVDLFPSVKGMLGEMPGRERAKPTGR